jgi:hypothetical protein
MEEFRSFDNEAKEEFHKAGVIYLADHYRTELGFCHKAVDVLHNAGTIFLSSV